MGMLKLRMRVASRAKTLGQVIVNLGWEMNKVEMELGILSSLVGPSPFIMYIYFLFMTKARCLLHYIWA